MALPLSSIASGIRNIGSAFNKSKVSSDAIRGTAPLTRNEFVQQSQQFAQNQQKNQVAIGGIQQQFQALQQQITILATGINNVAKLIQQDTASEQQLLQKQQQEEKVFTTRKLRRGRESELEQRIESAVMAPVQAAAAKTQDIFSRVGRALQIMFFGFLGVQALKMLKALQEGDENLISQIKNLILRNIGYALAALAAVKIGLPLIGLALRTLVSKVVGFLFKGIFSILRSAVTKAGQFMGSIASKIIPGLGGGAKAASTAAAAGAGTKLAQEGAEAAAKGGTRAAAGGFGKAAAKTAGRGILGSLPFIGTALDTWGAAEELSKGNMTGAGLYAAGAVTSLIPGMQLISGGLSVAALGQSLAYNPEKEKAEQTSGQPPAKDKKAPAPSSTPSSAKPSSSPAMTMPTMPALPQLNFPEKEEKDEEKQEPPAKPIQGVLTTPPPDEKKNKTTESTSSPPPLQISQNITQPSPQTTMLPSKSELSISPGNEDVKKDPDYLMAESEMWGAIADGLEMGLSYEELGMDQAQIDYVEGKTDKIPYLVDQMDTATSVIDSTPQKMPQIKPLEEPSPNVIVTSPQPSGSQPMPQSQMPQSDVPMIPSSNPDNFYVLYSKLNYNVTM